MIALPSDFALPLPSKVNHFISIKAIKLIAGTYLWAILDDLFEVGP